MKRCANKKCQDWIGDKFTLCPSCRYMARWAFGLGAFFVGAVAAIIKLVS